MGGDALRLTHRRAAQILALSGTVLLCCFAGLLLLGPAFDPDGGLRHQPVWAVTLLGILAGGAYLLLWPLRHDSGLGRRALWIALALGLLLRLLAAAGPPVLESDFNRYLWDGAVLLEGRNPYAVAPSEATGDTELAQLATLSGDRHRWINHPHLRSLYPLGAVAAFALGQALTPWELWGWKAVLLAAELAGLLLLLHLLRRLGRSGFAALLYWWNPIVIQQLFNAAHMEGLLVPLLLGALALALAERRVLACWLLGLAATVKIWPLLLLPLFLRPLLSLPRRLVTALGGALLLAALGILPVLLAGLGADSGLGAYASGWAANDVFFQALSALLSLLPGLPAETIARVLIAIGLGLLALALARGNRGDPARLARDCLILTAALFLTAPAQFPWYALWLLPFLPLWPNFALVLMALLLPLYYLRFHFEARGAAALFDHGVVWLEFLPVWALLAWQARPWVRQRLFARAPGEIRA